MSGYKERNRGGLTVYDVDGGPHLYDHNNNFKSAAGVWCVFRAIRHRIAPKLDHVQFILESVFENYDEAFDRAHKIDGAIHQYKVKKK